MKTKGFTCGHHGLVTLDQDLPYATSYISVSATGGSIVFQNTNGDIQYCPFAFVGWNIIAATKILSSGVETRTGVTRTTTASTLGWAAAGRA